MENSKYIVIAVVGILIIGGSLFAWGILAGQEESVAIEGEIERKVTMYKSPTCGCCVEHAAYLKKNGYNVEIKKVSDMSAIKDKYNIPAAMESCHTTIIGDYVVEGHIPIEAIDKLLAEQPDIDGIALPDMPAGSPGMPGTKKGPFEIHALSDGQVSTFTSL